MPTEIPVWFDYAKYMENKLEALNKEVPAGQAPYNLGDVYLAFEADGFGGEEGAYQHFLTYGAGENISPNAVFNAEEYYANKAKDYFSQGDEVVGATDTETLELQIQYVKDAFAAQGLNAWTHYMAYGDEEGIAPSASFNQVAYCAAKAALMDPKEDGSAWTAQEVQEAIAKAGMTVLEHYLQYGNTGKQEVVDDESILSVPAYESKIEEGSTEEGSETTFKVKTDITLTFDKDNMVEGDYTSLDNFVAAAFADAPAKAPLVKWFTLGEDSYIVLDRSASTAFDAERGDMIVKLTGVDDLSTYSITNSKLTVEAAQ